MLDIEVHARALIEALDNLQDHTGAAARLRNTLNELTVERSAYADEIRKAQEDCNSDDVQVDDDVFLSVADTGVWVSAWVWVPIDDDEETEDA